MIFHTPGLSSEFNTTMERSLCRRTHLRACRRQPRLVARERRPHDRRLAPRPALRTRERRARGASRWRRTRRRRRRRTLAHLMARRWRAEASGSVRVKGVRAITPARSYSYSAPVRVVTRAQRRAPPAAACRGGAGRGARDACLGDAVHARGNHLAPTLKQAGPDDRHAVPRARPHGKLKLHVPDLDRAVKRPGRDHQPYRRRA